MDIETVRQVFIQAGLKRLTKDTDALAKPSIRLNATPVDDEATLATGTSRLGGLPDLPPGLAWPVWQGLPQAFIAQINLQEVHSSDVEQALPAHGLLWFFYDARQETYGDDPANRGGWSVFYSEKPEQLQHAAAPKDLPAESLFKAASLSGSSEITLSQVPAQEIAHFDWSDEEQEQYDDLLFSMVPPEKRPFRHRLLGNPDLIQDDLRLQSQLVSHGSTGDEDDPETKKLEAGASEWRLLLQVDTDERIGMRWASSGMLYYSITATDLKAQRFDNTWLILQSD
jgi:uncharacterized protein YwqG